MDRLIASFLALSCLALPACEPEPEPEHCAACDQVAICCEAAIATSGMPQAACDSAYQDIGPACHRAYEEDADVAALESSCVNLLATLYDGLNGTVAECDPSAFSSGGGSGGGSGTGDYSVIPATTGASCPADVLDGDLAGTAAIDNAEISRAADLRLKNPVAGITFSAAYVVTGYDGKADGVIVTVKNDTEDTICRLQLADICALDAQDGQLVCDSSTSLHGTNLADSATPSCLRPAEVGYFSLNISQNDDVAPADIATLRAELETDWESIDSPTDLAAHVVATGYTVDVDNDLTIVLENTGTATAHLVVGGWSYYLDDACAPLGYDAFGADDMPPQTTQDVAVQNYQFFAGSSSKLAVRTWYEDL